MAGTSRVLLTGGSGRLGTELRALMPFLSAPSSSTLDVTSYEQVTTVCSELQPSVIVHAAAFTNVGAAETERSSCWNVNVVGTRNIALAAQRCGARLVHISTDYVFSGDSGNYNELDIPGPVANFYALTKLVAEEAARLEPNAIVVRTSFRPREWPYEAAFTDLFSSQDYVDVIAPEIALLISNLEHVKCGTLHVATERKSAFDLAKRRKADVIPALRGSVSVSLPYDVSLDTTLWRRLKQEVLVSNVGLRQP